jgi:ABC-2 type transport system permease protein
MPIYDQGYRPYEARRPLRRLRFWPITREALRLLLARRAFLVLLAMSWVPLVFRAIQIYIVTRFPDASRLLPVDGRTFGDFLNQQIGFALIITIFGGAGLIANDLRTGAILVYLSRPLTRRDYVLGKLGVLLTLNLGVTLVPGLLLYAVALSLAAEQFMKLELAWIAPAIVLHSIVIALVLSLVALAISSLSKNARVAGLAFVGLLVGLEVAHGVLRNVYHRPESALLSLQADLRAIGGALFGNTERWLRFPWPYAALVLVAVALACLATLRARVRAVEIVR